MGSLASVDVNIKIDNKTLIMVGVAILLAVALGVIIGKRV